MLLAPGPQAPAQPDHSPRKASLPDCNGTRSPGLGTCLPGLPQDGGLGTPPRRQPGRKPSEENWRGGPAPSMHPPRVSP
ncbi:unnamed protein product [Gulo gulo]|uniref:Uncharacterized protein n=1 Tax=Gulo gulo TaxID=48420 RepID=A0A9X9M6P1_GULGU|nr:unnamed protein product [Gulo gulo]